MPIQNLCLLLAGLLAQPHDWMTAGHRALDEGRAKDAAAAFHRALEEGNRGALPPGQLLRIRIALATAYMEGGDLRAADTVLRQSQTDDPHDRAALLNARGSLHLMQNRLSDALKELSEARRLLGKAPDAGELLGTVLHNLSGAELREGRYADALAHAEEALHLLAGSLKPGHPNLIRVQASKSAVEYVMGEPRRAQNTMREVIASAETHLGLDHPLLADLLDSDAVILDRLHKKKEAKAARERAMQIRGTSSGPPKRMTWDVREALLPAEVVTK